MTPVKKHYYLLSIVLALFNTVYGQTTTIIKDPTHISNNKKLENIKFGVQLQDGLSDLYDNSMGQPGIFGEYKFHKKVGLRTGLFYTSQGRIPYRKASIKNPSGFSMQSISVPVILRVYPASNLEEWCFFIGVQPGYIIDGAMHLEVLKNKETIRTLTEMNKRVNIQRFQLHIISGCDYEFGFGLNLGVIWFVSFINIIKAEKCIKNNFGYSVGYNFAKLLKYFY
ncbi:MAG: hypothetical protein BGO68_01940 [Candidatus Amoebophilus sp. 36-38]|nr:MAG: hypothetical protein BGO68_01940 [Candidatus Amoebophilus sp. 36-38]